MANDSDIHSWDLRQADFQDHTFYRNDSTTSKLKGYDFLASQSRARESHHHSPPNGYSSRCQHRTRATRSGSDVRSINPAIYGGPLEGSQPVTIIEANCGDSSTLVERVSSLSISGAASRHAPDHAGDQHNGPSTYRCQPLISPPTPSSSSLLSSTANSKSSVKIRCCTIGKTSEEQSINLSDQPDAVQRYAVNGHRVVEYSASSVSTSNLSDRQGSTNGKKNAYEEWIERKKAAELRRKEEARRREQEKQTEEQRLAKEKEEREQRERENFLQWAERKRKEEASKREAAERELELEKRLKEIEDKAMMAKTIHLRQWARKKEEQQKALQRKHERRQRLEEEERQKRLEESSKAYEKWRETSKNRPRPATQGLLPHQKATPSYINPNPWVVDDVDSTDETSKNQSSSTGTKKTGLSRTKNNVRKNVVPFKKGWDTGMRSLK